MQRTILVMLTRVLAEFIDEDTGRQRITIAVEEQRLTR
jgi:hypothetical protein